MLISTDDHSPTCVVADGLLTFATDIAAQARAPLLYFDTISPSAIWTYMCLPKLIQLGDLPFKGAPHAPNLAQIRELCPNIYAIGPLHALLLRNHTGYINSTSTWKEDRSCISWLDNQPARSVLYVSIGSLCVMTKKNFFEILHGIVSSGSGFLWVRRPGSVAGLDPVEIPLELARATEERGARLAGPRSRSQEVLAHPAVGGFVGEVWKVGLNMKDSCDRVVVEKMVREVMEVRKDKFLERAREMSEASVGEGGSSAADLDRLIDDIKNMRLSTKHE
ncbi:hypothetical protein SASPL_104857 [Salvia splendens]|uniref:Uncharacterized protein n=1 Tax=Salvia splendens TaxID=180675 RepID=A0A8X8YK26_SALSN|nr:hypothetical protein SASPL_104857 [Salvia splendens]